MGVPQESLLQIQTVLKGEDVPKQLRLFHFRYRRVEEGGEQALLNPPSLLLSLKPSPPQPLSGKTLAWAPPARGNLHSQDGHYLMFLKRRKDGRAEPAGGQIDPINSVFSLTKAGPAFEQP